MPDLIGLVKSFDCDQRTGVKEIYIGKYNEVASITFDASTREVATLVMSTGNKGYKIEVDEDETSLASTGNGSFGTRSTHLLQMSIYKVGKTVREIVQSMDLNSCMFAIVKYYNGKAFLVGCDLDSTNSDDPFDWRKKLNASSTETSGIVTDTGETAVPKIIRGYQWTQDYALLEMASDFNYGIFTTVVS